MEDPNNSGQFGNRPDTEEQASDGGQSQGQENNPGNFANDPQKASDAGQQSSSQGQSSEDDEE
jgi:general stress protein YciG